MSKTEGKKEVLYNTNDLKTFKDQKATKQQSQDPVVTKEEMQLALQQFIKESFVMEDKETSQKETKKEVP